MSYYGPDPGLMPGESWCPRCGDAVVLDGLWCPDCVEDEREAEANTAPWPIGAGDDEEYNITLGRAEPREEAA